MQHLPSKYKFLISSIKFIAVVLLFLIVGVNEANAATITSTGSGNWNSTTPNAPWPGGTVPAVGDIVIIANTHTVTLTSNVTKSGGSVTVNQGGTLVCNAALAIAATAVVEVTISGTVDITVANGLNRSGATNANVTSTGVVILSTTVASVGIQTWTLQTGSTVKLTAAGNQTLDTDFLGSGIDNLILSNSGIKTLGENTTVSQLLSLDGTASFALGGRTLAFGGAAAIQYLTTDVRNVGSEWPATFSGTGGVIIGNTAGLLTLNAAKVLNASATLTINSGATLATGNFQMTLGGNFTNSGTFNAGSSAIVIANTMLTQSIAGFTTTGLVSMTKTAGTAIFTGDVSGAGLTINGTGGTLNLGTTTTHSFSGNVTLSAGTLNSGSSTLTTSGNWTNNGGTFTPNTGTVTFAGNNFAINGTATSQTFNNIVLAKTAGQTLSVNGSTTTLNIGGTFTETTGNFTAPATMAVTGDLTLSAGTFTAGTNLSTAGNWVNNGATFTPGAGTVSIIGAAKNIGGTSSTTFNNLTINNAGGATLGNSQTVNGTLTLTNGLLNLGANNLTLGAASPAVAGTLNASNMIVTDGAGVLRKIRSANGSYTFPVGETTGTTEYSPITLNFASGTYAVGAYVGVKVVNAKQPNNSSTTDYLNRYWTLSQSGITSFSTTATGTFVPADVAGSVANMTTGLWAGALPWQLFGAVTSSTITAAGLTTIGDLTGVASPLINNSAVTLTGFTYMSGSGPSTEQSYTVSGSSLIGNLVVTPPTNYEISLTTGGAFVAANPITLTPTSGTVAATTVYVRLKAGLAVTSYNAENIASTSTSAVTKNVAASGTVTNIPLITNSSTTLTGFTYISGSGPSAIQSYTVSGSFLIGNISVTPPTNYEISLATGGAFVATNPITLTPTTGTVATTTIYIRLKAGLAIASYNAENIAATSTSAVTKNVAASGTVTNIPLITTSATTLTGFTYISGSGPSTEQSYTVSGSSLVGNISIAPSTNYEISLTTGGAFVATNPITLTPSTGTVAATTIYVRLKAGLAVATYNAENIAATSTSAVTKNVAASGTVTNIPLITTSVATLTGFAYNLGAGPSAQQSFTIGGTFLIANITVTPSTNFEISTTSGTGFQSTPITLIQTSGVVSSTPIYVRLKAGLVTAYYTSENVVSTSTNATTKNVSCSGFVGSPLITTSVTSLSGFSYAVGVGPSTEQTFTVSGLYLTANMLVTPSTNFEISLTSGSGFQSTPITLAQSGGSVATTTIYVRLKAGLTAGNYFAENIVSSSTGATVKNVSCSGSVGSPTIISSIASLSGFSYSLGAGPSSEQSFTIHGAYLSTNITVTPSTNFEISTTSGTGFQSTPITLTQSGGVVATSTIYVRLKTGLAVGTYAAQNIASSSTGATTVNVAVAGSVYTGYCASAGNITYPTGITLVNFNTINNVSAKPSAYSDYLTSSTNVFTGSNYNLNVNLNTDGNYVIYATAWVDWNKNGSFADAGETYSLGTTSNNANGLTSLSPLSITIPATASLGNTRMRISAKFSSTSTSCETGFDGEVEDYTLNVLSPTITTGTIAGPLFAGASVSVPFTIGGSYIAGNVFTAQLSNASGSFASPVNIGTLTSTSAGSISAILPITTGSGFRIRVIGSTPAIIGSDNGINLVINTTTSPFIINSVSSLSGFSYAFGYGPSAEQSYAISGGNLTANITVTPPTNFEISTGTGASFVASSLLTLPASGGIVATTNIYVRMKTGLALGAVTSANVVSTSTGATTKNVACSGTVATAPVITTSVSSLSGFTVGFTAGYSPQQSFTVSGTNLIANVTVTAPADYEISTTSGTGFVSTTISLTQTAGTLAATTIYVRLKNTLGVGTYVENVVASSTSATSQNVSCSGTVTPSPTLISSTSFLGGFIYATGTGPSGSQSFVVTGSGLTANVTVLAPDSFEISTNNTTFVKTIILTQVSGAVTSTIYARLKSGKAAGTYGPSNVSLTSTGAVVKTVAFAGAVVGAATIATTKSTITGFGYLYSAGGPSSEQSFTVSGALLTANVIVTPPTNYEISTTSGSGFVSTAITLTQTSGRVNPTSIYVRLKSGLTAGNYTGVNITVASTGITTKNVACVGIVFISPLVTAGGGGSFCAGSTINLTSVGADILNRYWQGPNTYYSTAQNPTITNSTTAMTGTYTVTGNVVVGGNLVTNGDFENGNASFGSSYTISNGAVDGLWPESVYAVIANPNSQHSNFSTCADHTSGTGKQMVVNGAPVAGVVIWSQSVPVVPGASYEFTYWVQTVVATSPSQLQLYVNGVAAGPIYTADLTTCTWKQFIYNTTAGSNTSLNLELINENVIANGNDFALDDIVFQQILPATSSVDVTVSPIVPVSVTVAASANPVYSNTPVTFTATPTNGGATPAYQWKVNGVAISGATNVTYTYPPLQGDIVLCELTSSLTCVTNNPANANVVMNVITRVNYWFGYNSTDWGTASNWTANYVPLTGDDVEYATVANFGSTAIRDLQLDIDRTIGSLINATTKRLLIPAAKGLLVNNTISTDNNPDRIYIYSSTTLANGSLSYHNAVNNPVYASIEMYSKASWNLGQIQGSRYQWQYFGIPLRSVVAYPQFTDAYVRKWYETGTTISNHWIQLKNDSVVRPFYGYELCQENPKTYLFKGALENGNFSSGQLAITSTALYPGQHVFANPYTAAIDIKQLTFGTQTEATVYLYHTGTYNAWTTGGETAPGTNPGYYVAVPKNQAGNFGIIRQVPSMQEMLVKAMTVSSEATFGITYNSVVMNNTDPQRVKRTSENGSSDKTSTIIELKGAKSEDKLWLMTDEACTRNFDNGWDGFKIIGSSMSPQLFAMEKDGNYQVNAVSDINNTDLGFQAGTDVEYTLNFTHENLKAKYAGLYLVDLLENRTIDISESGSEYKFMAESTATPVKRFKIVTRYYEKDATDNDSQIKVFSAKGNIFVQNLGNASGELMLYNMSGRMVKRMAFNENTISTITSNLIPGAYIVKAKTNNEEVSKRIIVQ